jgi:hypothetical protein
MNQIRQLCAATLLIVVIAASPVFAGEMPFGITSPPPPKSESSVAGNMPTGVTSSSTTSDASVTGEMPCGVASAVDPLTEFTLSLLQSVLALF